MLFLCDNAPKKRQIHTNVHPGKKRKWSTKKKNWATVNGNGRQNGKYFYINEIISLVCFIFLVRFISVCVYVSERVSEWACICVGLSVCLQQTSRFFYEYIATITFTLVFSSPLEHFVALPPRSLLFFRASLCLWACEWSGKYNSHNPVWSKFTLSDCCKGVVRIIFVCAFYCRHFIALQSHPGICKYITTQEENEQNSCTQIHPVAFSTAEWLF